MEAEPVFKINHDSSLIKHVKKVVRETSAPQPLTNSERAELIPVYAATPEPVSVPDERAAFETFMEKRFKDCIDRRLVKNGDGEYFAWDMQVAWIAWKGRAAMLQAGNHTEQHLDMVDHFVDASEKGKDGTLINEGTMPATQIKPVADLYSIISPTGSETTFTFDASEASSFVGSGWSVQEYVELERYQEAITVK